MKFTVNGNEIEVYKGLVIHYEGTDNYYYVAVVTLADYRIEILEEDLGLALSNIDSIEKFKEFANTYDNLEKVRIREWRIQEKYEEEQRLLDKELELESYIRHMESIEQEE